MRDAIIASSANSRKPSSFHGGIHPPEHKSESNQTPISTSPLPPRLVLPVQQHMGKPAKLVVEEGDRVLKGQRLAQADGFVSAHVHAPTSGTITAIGDHNIPHPSGMSDLCIELTPDGEDQWCDLEAHENYLELPIDTIRERVRAAGIAGMGGAGFPSEVKMHPPQHDKINTLILNAAECEPYITADDRLMRERADEIVKGIEIIAYVLQPGECLIGIEDNKPEAIEALKRAVAGTRIEIVVVPTKYPSGGEKQLIQLLTDKEVPSGKIPADIGVVCHNVGTAVAIYRAVRFGEPLISRITTLTGEQIAKPGNVEVLIGTPIRWLVEQYGYQASNPERILMGGPMMGFALHDLDTPVVKTTNCLLAPSLQELPLSGPAQACIRCGLCAEACPAELLPQQLYWFSRSQEYEKAEHHNLFDCIECGACSYVCPSAIPLVHYYRHAKSEIKQQRMDQEKSDRARIRFEARLDRLEREKEEKEAKRKARAEAAAKAQAEKAKAASQSAPAAPSASVAAATPKPASPETPEVDLATLKSNWEKAQAKLDKMLDTLEQAKQDDDAELVAKLSRAVEKNQVRVNQAKSLYQKALAQQNNAQAESPQQATPNAAGPGEAPDLGSLKTAREKAEAKLEKMQDALNQAKQDNNEDQVAKLTRAVEKNQVRVNQAKEQYASALAQQETQQSQAAPPSTAPQTVEVEAAPDLDALKTASEKAEAKLEKMLDALDQAKQQNNEEQVAKLTRAVEKNQVRAKAAKNLYQNALEQTQAKEAPTQETSQSGMSAADIETLRTQLEKAQIKLEKMRDALEDAKENTPDQVERLTRAVEKNEHRVQMAADALAEAQQTGEQQ